jgi:hypothetical protein
MRGGIAIQRDPAGNAALLNRLLQEPLGRSYSAPFTQEKINSLSFSVHSAVKVYPSPFDSNVRFIAPPRGTHRSGVTLPALDKFRDVPLDPAHYGGVRQGDSSFSHHCSQVSIAQFIREIPSRAEQNDLSVKVTALE